MGASGASCVPGHIGTASAARVAAAIAGKALLGSTFRITAERGEPRSWGELTLVPTIHPSAILRADPSRGQDADAMFAGSVADLRVAPQQLP